MPELTRVWDLPTRLFHWSLVLLVCFSGITGEFGDDFGANVLDWHARSGYAILTLLLFRLLWGFVGGTHARFRSFVRRPRAVLAYLRQLRAGKSERHLGHNPAGGWSVLLMLACLSLQVGTGLFLSDDDLGFTGPLANYVSDRMSDRLHALHEANFIVLMVLVALHLLAIAYHLWVKKENLVSAMVSGKKPLPAPAQRGGHPLLGALVLAIGAAAVWFIVNRL
ncbi:putative Ni/Fe-hydrogenase B-type cytochrome subunit [mine drainage metagenome]|uniref:Putative Ni/Fe-hydrogenase B-type cytochrome subunit n=1 Tax=mine drainage metagenome TaxID=410659 RepID=A0A1J5S798_9ZZZZ